MSISTPCSSKQLSPTVNGQFLSSANDPSGPSRSAMIVNGVGQTSLQVREWTPQSSPDWKNMLAGPPAAADAGHYRCSLSSLLHVWLIVGI